jgi:hypothetical protein
MMPRHILHCMVLSICIPALATAAVSQPVYLRETATVQASRIMLSDLFPAEAPLALRRQGAEVTLGASPNLGTTRVFVFGEIEHALADKPELLRQLALPERVLVRRDGFPLDRDSLGTATRQFLKQRGWQVPDAALDWDREIVTRKANPALIVTRARCDLSRKSAQLSMRCVDRGACPDFLVRVENTSCSGNDWPQLPPSPTAPPSSASSANQMKEGSRAWLIIDGGGIRFGLAVVCLERGLIGQTIRVLSPSNHRVFLAEIVGAGMLHMRSAS